MEITMCELVTYELVTFRVFYPSFHEVLVLYYLNAYEHMGIKTLNVTSEGCHT